MKQLFKTIALIWVSMVCLGIDAQISSNAFFSEQTNYPDGILNDPIFYFTDLGTAELTAPNGVSYQWFQYNNTSNTFETLVGETNNTLRNLGEYGYQVQVNDGTGFITNHYCWVFVPSVSEPSITILGADCVDLIQLASLNYTDLVYYNHKNDHTSIAVDYAFSYDWSSTPLGPIESEITQEVKIDAPTEDTRYNVSISSKFSPDINVISTSHDFVAIAVKAVLLALPSDPAENELEEGSAEIKVNLYGDFNPENNEPLSLGHIDEYKFSEDDLLIDYQPQILNHRINDIGDNIIMLTVTNLESGCSRSASETFTTSDMVVKVPGAFTPFSSPGKNDEFRVLYRSVRKFKMVIINRWGRTVYSSTNPAEGWDGKIKGRKAEPGVYFYMIEAEGFNEDESTQIEGAVHLIIKND